MEASGAIVPRCRGKRKWCHTTFARPTPRYVRRDQPPRVASGRTVLQAKRHRPSPPLLRANPTQMHQTQLLSTRSTVRQQAICKRYSSTGPPDGWATWSSANVSAPRSPQWVGQPSIVAVPGALYPLRTEPLFVEPRLMLLRCCVRCCHLKHLRQPLLVRLLPRDSVGMVSRCEGSLQPFRVHCALRLVKSAMHIDNMVRINCSPLDLEYLAFLICDVR